MRRERDAGAPLLFALLLLTMAALVLYGTLDRSDGVSHTVALATTSDRLDLRLWLRDATMEISWEMAHDQPTTLLAQDLAAVLDARARAAAEAGVDADMLLAGGDAPRVECDGSGAACVDGSDADLVEPDGTYEDDLGETYGSTCYGDLAYDGVSDGVVADGDDLAQAALVWIRLRSATGAFEEVLVIDAP